MRPAGAVRMLAAMTIPPERSEPPAVLWVCPLCKEPIDQEDVVALGRHHEWHRLVDQQRLERNAG
jgi:hypothetical protein